MKIKDANIPALGIDLGGTKMLAALVHKATIISEVIRVSTPKGPEQILKAFASIVNDFQNRGQTIAGVGIATAGEVQFDTGVILGSVANIPGWEGTEVKKLLAHLQLPVYVENDANAAAYGEYCATPGLNGKTIIVITLGTGIGGGFIMNGQIYRGAHFGACEVGSMCISLERKRLCTCGKHDCWEAYGSGGGFVATAKEIMSAAQIQLSAKAEDVVKAAQASDPVAINIMNTWHGHVAIGLANLFRIYDPNCIFIGGGMGKFIDYPLLHTLVSERAGKNVQNRLYPSTLGENAGLLGAGQLVLDSIYSGK